MTEKEKIELKIEILNDLKNSMVFNFGSIDYTLSKFKIEDLIAQYEEKIKEIK